MAIDRPHWMRPGAAQSRTAASAVGPEETDAATGRPAGWHRVPPPLRLFLVMMGLLAGWYGVLGAALAGIDVDLAIRPTAEQLPPGGSVFVGMAARLIEHQVIERSFTLNDPVFYPTGLARRTPAFQSGLILTVADAVAALDEAGPAPGLSSAAQSLSVGPHTWWLRAAWPPVGLTAERHYRNAQVALSAHNRAIASAERPAIASRTLQPGSRAALMALLQRVEGEAARGNRILRSTEEGSASVQLSSARGTAFAAAMLMRGIRDDNAGAIRMSGRAARWGEALDALDAAAAIDPLFVGDDDLVKSGYSLLLAGNAMRDILGGQG